MSLLPVLLWPDPRLSQRCRDVDVAHDVAALAADLLDTMYHAAGRGLAAPQVGAMVRVFVMDCGWKEGAAAPMVFVNPEVVGRSEATATRSEGCLSIPGVAADVTRASVVRVRWLDLDAAAQEREFSGFEATCVQHEMDHLDGVLTLDRVDPATRVRLIAERAA